MHVNNQPTSSTSTEYLLKEGTVSLSFNRGHKQETTYNTSLEYVKPHKINTNYKNSFIHLTNDYHVGSARYKNKMVSATII